MQVRAAAGGARAGGGAARGAAAEPGGRGPAQHRRLQAHPARAQHHRRRLRQSQYALHVNP